MKKILKNILGDINYRLILFQIVVIMSIVSIYNSISGLHDLNEKSIETDEQLLNLINIQQKNNERILELIKTLHEK